MSVKFISQNKATHTGFTVPPKSTMDEISAILLSCARTMNASTILSIFTLQFSSNTHRLLERRSRQLDLQKFYATVQCATHTLRNVAPARDLVALVR